MSLARRPLLNDVDPPSQSFELDDVSKPDIQTQERKASMLSSVRTLSEQLDQETQVITNKNGIAGCIFNYTNSIIGAGIIGLPYALKISGFYYGVFLLVAVAILIDYGVRSLIECGLIKGKQDYELLVEHLYGRPGYYAVTTFMFLFAYGAMVAYHVVIGDTMYPLIKYATKDTEIEDSFYTQRWFIIMVFSIIFMLPLSLLRNMSALSHTSGISITAVLVIVSTICIEAPLRSENVNHDKPIPIIRSGFFEAIGTMSFAFVCRYVIMYIYVYLCKICFFVHITSY